ncbi:MAG: HD domain-containing protein [Deltaproteobacteria bacterium]|jgi:putative hydrolase of HD superfamily|nr:HD domain-containing protein [Deltaproteobacteria bacterium]
MTGSAEGRNGGLADFVYEALFLKRTPRSGYKFLGRGEESVAEHSYGAILVSFVLSRMRVGVDTEKMLKLALFHDLPEARTGDLNYMNKRYVKSLEDKALADLAAALPFEDELKELRREWVLGESPEVRLVRDADQLDMIAELSRHETEGSESAGEWIRYALKRLQTPEGKALAAELLRIRHDRWWFEKKDAFWVNPADPFAAGNGEGGSDEG